MKNDNSKLSNNKQKKEVIIAELSDKVGKSKAIIFTSYQGMTHHQIEALKKTVKKMDAEFVITKNRLLKRALGNELFPQEEEFQGGTATLFAYADIIAPLKELTKSFKTIQFPAIKFGIVEGKMISEKEVITFSTLPPKEVLLAKMVGGLKSPLFGLHRALNWNLQQLVMTLKAIETKKS